MAPSPSLPVWAAHMLSPPCLAVGFYVELQYFGLKFCPFLQLLHLSERHVALCNGGVCMRAMMTGALGSGSSSSRSVIGGVR